MNRKNLLKVLGISVFLATASCITDTDTRPGFFMQARPVWPEGLQNEKNLTAGFRAEFKQPANKKAVLKITGSTLYRIYLNGEFIGHGPARAGHGYYRVDEWDLSDALKKGTNVLAVEVAGYNVNSYYLLDQPSFLQAEVVSGTKLLAATSHERDDFEARILTERVQKVPRYSFQRPFVEYYKMKPGYDEWRVGKGGQESRRAGGQKEGQKVEERGERLEFCGEKRLIARGVSYPEFEEIRPVRVVAHGRMETGIKRERYWKDRSVVNIGEKLKGFREEELEINPAIELQEMEIARLTVDSADWQDDSRFVLTRGGFVTFDMGANLTGFAGTRVIVEQPSRLYLAFDEILTDRDVDFKRLGTIAAVTYDLEPGTYWLESIEPYTFRYLKFIVANGECTIQDACLREYANPDVQQASFNSGDERLNRIFAAGVETFRQNAVDLFMDCPHRERAGWLCDSYFTARVASDVSGNTLIEKNFYENFLLPDSFAFIPEGMLPMCYPADHNDGVFIPNWAMWFVVELEEYLQRSQDRQLVDALEPRVMALLDYFRPFKNEDGLLEKLDSWIFVEWSAANSFVQDVNYPTNMLFAATLDAAGRLYDRQDLLAEAAAIRAVIREQAWNGEFFADNAVRRQKAEGKGQKGGQKEEVNSREGDLVVTGNTSEVCQYFAFYFGVATPETFPVLWKKLSTEFGPKRQEQGLYPNVHPANSFVGNYIRLELLSRYNLQQQLLIESIDFFDYMALETGTLWENISPYASCNHGFASHVVHVLYRDVLGIAGIDTKEKVVTFRFPDLDLDSCEGQMPVGKEVVKLSWKREGDSLNYHYDLPKGFSARIIQ